MKSRYLELAYPNVDIIYADIWLVGTVTVEKFRQDARDKAQSPVYLGTT